VAAPRGDSKLLDLVGQVMGLLDVDEFRRGLLGALKEAVPSQIASLNEVTRDGRLAVVSEPEFDQEWYELFGTLVDENPLYRHYVETSVGGATRFSDVTTRVEFRKTRIYREFYALLGIEHQIAFTLPSGAGDIVAVALSRGDRDYTDAERDFLNRARPYLIQAYRNAVAYTERRAADPSGLEPALVAGGLTQREAEVVASVALGGSNRAVATRLALSERTVQKHLERAFRKLGVSSRSEAAARAWELAGG